MSIRNIQNLSTIFTKIVPSVTQIYKNEIRQINISSTSYKSERKGRKEQQRKEHQRKAVKTKSKTDLTGKKSDFKVPPTSVLSSTVKKEDTEKDEAVGKLLEAKGEKTLRKTYKPKKQRQLKNVNVAIVGACEKAGQVLAFQLKQHPLIKKLYLHGDNCKGLADDLNQIDTSCTAHGYNHDNHLHRCLRTADIVVLMDDMPLSGYFESGEPGLRFYEVAEYVTYLAEKCTFFCPRAIIVSCIQPICCTVPLIQEIFKQTPWAHPMKVLGCVSPLQSRMNTIVARYLDLDPTYVHVPVIGGTDHQSIVPVMSQIVPNPALTEEQVEELLDIITDDFSKVVPKRVNNFMCDGYSIAQFVITIARGLTGDKRFVAPALLRSNLIDRVKFMVSTVEFGEGGITTNYGIPKMTQNETRAFQRAIATLVAREKLVKKYVKQNISRSDDDGNFTYYV